MSVRLKDLVSAFEWVSSGGAAMVDAQAWVCRADGTVHLAGEGVDEVLPDDIDDDELYLMVPQKADLDLGRDLALQFIDERLPASFGTVTDIFRSRGAYGRFKSLLSEAHLLDDWHRYEESAVERVLRGWCIENDMVVEPPV